MMHTNQVLAKLKIKKQKIFNVHKKLILGTPEDIVEWYRKVNYVYTVSWEGMGGDMPSTQKKGLDRTTTHDNKPLPIVSDYCALYMT